ncbi:MAG TPA: hypothetical protein VHV08_04995 [Pirellulales bacterium]|nr:hypothetical protein [Pirellulales bacterium]
MSRTAGASDMSGPSIYSLQSLRLFLALQPATYDSASVFLAWQP